MGQKIENEFKFSKKVSFPLEPGVWEVINREVWFFGAVKVRLIGLILVENNEFVAFREFQELKLSGGYQADLNKAINEKIIFGAGLDVFEKEPVDINNPLLKNNKVLLSPHSATFTNECKSRMSLETTKNIIDFFANKIDKSMIVKL